MAGQKKVGDALLNSILMPAVATNKLAFRNLCLEQQVVQILQSLLISLQLLGGRSLLGKFGEAKLLAKKQSVSELHDNIEVVQFCCMFRPIEDPVIMALSEEPIATSSCRKSHGIIVLTSEEVVRRAAQSSLGRTLMSIAGFSSISS